MRGEVFVERTMIWRNVGRMGLFMYADGYAVTIPPFFSCSLIVSLSAEGEGRGGRILSSGAPRDLRTMEVGGQIRHNFRPQDSQAAALFSSPWGPATGGASQGHASTSTAGAMLHNKATSGRKLHRRPA